MFSRAKKYKSEIKHLKEKFKEKLKEAEEENSNLRREMANLSLALENYSIDDVTEGLYCLNSAGERRRVHCINGSWYVYKSLGSRFCNYHNAVLPLEMTEGYRKAIKGMDNEIPKQFCYDYMRMNGYIIASNTRV